MEIIKIDYYASKNIKLVLKIDLKIAKYFI